MERSALCLLPRLIGKFWLGRICFALYSAISKQIWKEKSALNIEIYFTNENLQQMFCYSDFASIQKSIKSNEQHLCK